MLEEVEEHELDDVADTPLLTDIEASSDVALDTSDSFSQPLELLSSTHDDVIMDEKEDQTLPEPALIAERGKLSSINDSFEAHLAVLERNIRKINDPVIQQRALDVKNKFITLHQQNGDVASLIGDVKLTNELLTSAPGGSREAIVAQYKQRAVLAQRSHSPIKQALGIAMILLGVAIAMVSTFSIVAGGLPLGILGGAGGAGLICNRSIRSWVPMEK